MTYRGGSAAPVYVVTPVMGVPFQGGSAAPVYVVNQQELSVPFTNVSDYGALGDGVTDDTAAINAAISALPSTGGVIQLDLGVYVVNGTLTIQDKECVILRGRGAEHDALYTTAPTQGTVLKRVSGTGTLLSVGAVAAAASVSGVGVESLSIDGNNLAATGLLITSVYGGSFRDLHLRNCTSVALDVTTVDLTGVEDTQACVFERITIRQVESANGIGMRLGSGAAGLGNTSQNNMHDILVAHKNGAGYQLNDCDSNRFVGINTNRISGTAIGVELGASNHASSGHCRGNVFLFVNPGAGGLTARATGFTQTSKNNVIVGYSRENSAPLPTIEPNATLFFTTDRGLAIPALRPEFRVGVFRADDFIGGTTAGGSIGDLGWSQLGGTITYIAAIASHPGIINIDTTAVSGTLSGIRLGAIGTGGVLATDLFDCTFLVRLNTNDANTLVRAGIANSSASNPPTGGAYIEKVEADTQWFGVCRAGGSQTRTAALANVTTGWIKLRIRRVDSTTIGFSLDDGTEVTLATNVPTDAQTWFVQIRNSTGASKTIDIDYVELLVSGIAR